MVRVVYRWRVAPEHYDAFLATWRATTNRIHDTVPGALGSFMMRSSADGCDVLTIARWTSREAWERFWGDERPPQMQRMGALAHRVSVEVFEEIEDHTRSPSM
ncbi:MAG: antibiotic biosynthesis monooxygenase [Pseudomonadota bacterium]